MSPTTPLPTTRRGSTPDGPTLRLDALEYGDLVFDVFPTSTRDLPSLVLLETILADQLKPSDVPWGDVPA